MQVSFFKNKVVIMIFSGLVIKLLALFYKMVLSRMLSIHVLSTFYLLAPTIMLFLGLASFSLTEAITKLVSENEGAQKRNQSTIKKSLLIGLVVDFFLCLILFVFSKVILKGIHLESYKGIMWQVTCIILLVTLNAIIRGYLQGTKRIVYGSFANIIEQFIRILSSLLILFFVPLTTKGMVSILVWGMFFGECGSFLFSLFLLRKKRFQASSDRCLSKSILDIALPLNLNRAIFMGSNFIEPILFTLALKTKMDLSSIKESYAIQSGYVLPLLIILSFISIAISSVIFPTLSRLYQAKKKKECELLLQKGLVLSLVAGVFSSLLILKFPKTISSLIYGEEIGISFLRILAPAFIIYYMEPVLNIALVVISKSKIQLSMNILILVIKLSLIFFLSKFFSENGLSYAISISIFLTILSSILLVNRYIRIRFNSMRLFIFLGITIVYLVLIPLDNLLFLSLSFAFILLVSFLFFKQILISLNNE